MLQRNGLDGELLHQARMLDEKLTDIEVLGFYEADLTLDPAYDKLIRGIQKAKSDLDKAARGDSNELLDARVRMAQELLERLRPKLLISETFANERSMVSKLFGLGFFDDPELEEAVMEVAASDEHQTMKKLLGEYLGREKTIEKLAEEGLAYDEVFTSVFLIKLFPRTEEPVLDNDRSGPVVGNDAVRAWQQGEFDTLFCRRVDERYAPVVLLESKGGKLSTQAVRKQKNDERDRLVSVARDPENLALATRPHPKRGPFTIITDRFVLDPAELEGLPVVSSGPTREGHQYDVDLELTSEQLEHYGRFVALYRIEYLI